MATTQMVFSTKQAEHLARLLGADDLSKVTADGLLKALEKMKTDADRWTATVAGKTPEEAKALAASLAATRQTGQDNPLMRDVERRRKVAGLEG